MQLYLTASMCSPEMLMVQSESKMRSNMLLYHAVVLHLLSLETDFSMILCIEPLQEQAKRIVLTSIGQGIISGCTQASQHDIVSISEQTEQSFSRAC